MLELAQKTPAHWASALNARWPVRPWILPWTNYYFSIFARYILWHQNVSERVQNQNWKPSFVEQYL